MSVTYTPKFTFKMKMKVFNSHWEVDGIIVRVEICKKWEWMLEIKKGSDFKLLSEVFNEIIINFCWLSFL